MALTILYDDQIQHQRGSSSHAHHGGPQLFSLAKDDDWSWGESSWWDSWEPWANYAGWPDEGDEWLEEPGPEEDGNEDEKKEAERGRLP